MKAYLVTTGLLFALLTVLHILRLIAEWPRGTDPLGPAVGMLGLIALTTTLALWACLLLRKLPGLSIPDGAARK